MTSTERPSLLTIPSELRNAIYSHLFQQPDPPSTHHHHHSPSNPPSDLAIALQLHPPTPPLHHNPPPHPLALLQTCRQIHTEAHLLALSNTTFHLPLETTYPEPFAHLTRSLPSSHLSSLRHLVLTARISHLRALNESWSHLPFAHPALRLSTLTLIPTRAEIHAHAPLCELADLSQAHALAYVLSETLKGLRNVEVVEVRNGGCFDGVVWRLLYRSMVYRLWRWGGGRCGVRFESGGEEKELEEGGDGGVVGEENMWFRAYLGSEENEERGRECGEEVCRLVGQTGEVPVAGLVGL